MKTRLATVMLLGLVVFLTACPPTEDTTERQPRETAVTVVITGDCYVKIADTVTRSDGLKLWKWRPVYWENKTDKVVVFDFGGMPLISGRDTIRLRPGESVKTRVTSRIPNGKYTYAVLCLKDRFGTDEGEEDEETSVDYEVADPPPDKTTGGGP